MNYELIAIVHPKSESDTVIAKIKKIVTENDGGQLTSKSLGKKTLAQLVRKQTEGEYVLFNFQAPGEAVRKIDNLLRLEQETILRYLITRTTTQPRPVPTVVVKKSKSSKQASKRKSEVTKGQGKKKKKKG